MKSVGMFELTPVNTGRGPVRYFYQEVIINETILNGCLRKQEVLLPGNLILQN